MSFEVLETRTLLSAYYVAVNGNDQGSGAIESPFKTFQKAVSTAVAGDTVYVRGGTYTKDNAAVYSVAWSTTSSSSYGAELMSDGQYHTVSRCFLPILDRSKADWWDTYAASTVNSGTEANPITVKAYAGERPILDCSGFTNFNYAGGSLAKPTAVKISQKWYWVIDGLEISGGIVDMWGGTGSDRSVNTHDITIQNCDIHDVVCNGGDNPGLIRIDRADVGGCYNIYIFNNKLHDLYQYGYNGVVNSPDAQHFGALTTLSTERYTGYANRGTGYIEFTGNEVYNCPQAFFFKNPMEGPVDIYANQIHNCQSLGMASAGYIHFYHNLVWGTPMGFWEIGWNGASVGGTEGISGTGEYDLLWQYAGSHATIEYNTFVDMTSPFSFRMGHDWNIHNNLFFGLTGRISGAGYSTTAYIGRSSASGTGDGNDFYDTASTATSNLQSITSDYNGFVSPYADMQMVQRNMPGMQEHYTASQALATFGYDPHSVFVQEATAANIFIDPANHDYRLKNPSLFLNMGYYAYNAGGPTVATAARATSNPVTGTTVSLAVLGTDDGGETSLTYTWLAVSKPIGAMDPTYSINRTNAAKNTTATFYQAGTYSFEVTITDAGGLTVTSSVSVTVSQTLTSVAVSPLTATLNVNQTQQFSATGYDQFGKQFAVPPSFTWSKTAGVGAIDSHGLYTAPTTSGSATIAASSGGVSGSAAVTINYANQAPSASVTTPSGTQTGKITISYTLTDIESDVCSIVVQYSVDGGSTWLTATAGSVVNGTTGLTSSPAGMAHTFVWASGSDIVNANNSKVKIRITPSDAAAGTAGTSGMFIVNNYANTSNVGLYDPQRATFYLRSSNDPEYSTTTINYGNAGWIPLVGDWDGDGKDTVGLYDPQRATFYLRSSTGPAFSTTTVNYGNAGWIPLIGDWDGDGKDTVGLYDPQRATFYLRSSNDLNFTTTTVNYGNAGWIPLIGDWDGDGKDTVGLYDPQRATFYLRSSTGPAFTTTTVNYGNAGWTPLIGDWNGEGKDSIGLYDPHRATFYLRSSSDPVFTTTTINYGNAGWIPLVGKWNGPMLGLMAADGEVQANGHVSQVTDATLQPLVTAAIDRWSAAGLSASSVALLQNVKVVIADLAGSYLGLAGENTIYIDRDAAGHGWFVDSTPGMDEEFALLSGSCRLQAISADVVDRIDLLTVVEHEMGHILGLSDLDLDLDNLMNGKLQEGVRLTPNIAAYDAFFARG